MILNRVHLTFLSRLSGGEHNNGSIVQAAVFLSRLSGGEHLSHNRQLRL